MGGLNMNMLEHTRVFTIRDAGRDVLDEKSDQLADALVDLEGEHAELLDSSVFTDLKEGSIGATITLGHSGTYAEAVAHADQLLLKAIHVIGDYFSAGSMPEPTDTVPVVIEDVQGPRSLAVA